MSNASRRSREYLTPDEVEKLLQASSKIGRHGARDRCLILLAYRHKPRTQSVMRQRGVVPSAELVPLQFRMPPEFVWAFKQAALDRDLKLNELLNEVFIDFMKKSQR
jgi:integrase